MTTLIPELAKEMAAFNRKAVDVARAATLSQETRTDAQHLLRIAITRGGDAKEVWQDFQERLKRGMPGEKARELVQSAREVAETWLELAQNIRGLAKDALEGLDQLDAIEQEVQEIRAAVEKVYLFFARPRPPIDEERLCAGLAEAQRNVSITNLPVREHGLLNPPQIVREIVAREKAKFAPAIFTPEAEERLLCNLTLQHYFEPQGVEVLYRSTPNGPEVVAVGDEERIAFTKGLAQEARQHFKTWMP
jgi:hypothetical protein